MGTRVQYQTLSGLGVDPTQYYTQVISQQASANPDNPAPSFLTGTRAFGSDGSEFVFVQASTSISLGDFVYLDAGTTSFPFSAASLTTANSQSQNAIGMGATGLVLRQSVTYIPANAYFWACTRGHWIPAQTSTTLCTNAPSVTLYSTTTPGVINSISVSTATAFQGIVCLVSTTVSIQSSFIPPIGTLTTTGYAAGPFVAMLNPRPFGLIVSLTVPGLGAVQVGW